MKQKILVFFLVMTFTFSFYGCANAQGPDEDNTSDLEPILVQLQDDLQCNNYNSPTLVGDELFVCVGKTDDGMTDKVVAYDIKSKTKQVLFESKMTEPVVSDTLANENWVVWLESDMNNAPSTMYALNSTSGETIKICESESSPQAYVTNPTLSENKVAWVEFGRDKKSTIKLYDLLSDEFLTIAQLNEPGPYNASVTLNGDELLWTDHMNGHGYYYLYSISTKETKKIEAPYAYPGFAEKTKELLYSINFDDYHNWGNQDFGWLDTSDSTYHSSDNAGIGDINLFHIGGSMLAVMDDQNKFHLIDMDKNDELDSKYPFETIDSIDVSEDGTVIAGLHGSGDQQATLVIYKPETLVPESNNLRSLWAGYEVIFRT